MRPVLFCLFVLLPLCGCAGATGNFSCGPQVAPQRIDVDQYTVAPSRSAAGFATCEVP